MTKQTATHATSFRVGSSFALPDVLRSLGYAPEKVFAEAGVDLALYSHPENRITARDLGRLFACAARVTGRQDLALLVVDSFQPQGLGLVGEIVAEGPDLETSLNNLVRLLQHNTLAGYPVLSASGSEAMMKFEMRDSDFFGSEFIYEGATGIISRFMRWLCGDGWRADEVHLCRRKPPDTDAFQRFFDAPIRFSATEDALLFAARWLGHPVPRERRRQQDRRLEIAAAPYSELVRRQVAMCLGLAPLDAQGIAARIGISRRQLFRRLKSEGTTFKALVDEFRFTRAPYHRRCAAGGDRVRARLH
jgi:hypothetical protein